MMKFLLLVSGFLLASAENFFNESQNNEVIGIERYVPGSLDSEPSFLRRVRISNGKVAVDGQFPWAARLVIKGPVWYVCSGSLISTNIVISNRHCIEGTKAVTVEVMLGAADTANRNQVTIYSEYWWWLNGPGYPLDIALFRLYSHAPLSRNIQPIRLPSAGQELYEYFEGVTATIQGYGGGKSVLNYGNVKIHSPTYCDIVQICSVGAPVQLEGGDSGGPMVIYENGVPTLIGVNFASSSKNGARYEISMRMTKFLRYIKDMVGIQIRPQF